MMPLSDDNTLRRTTPVVTYLLILINIVVFLMELGGGEEFIVNWAFVPKRFLANPIADSPTLLTSMFMHAGLAHLIGNMLYLWIFGDNVEDHFGKMKFLFFYIVCGIGATFSQLLFSLTSSIPNVGASGAIAGVLGAYILLWPKGKINVLVGNLITQMSALMVIGFWFFLQFISGMGSLATMDEKTGGVAYMAHIGGFIAGLAIAFIFRVTDPHPPSRSQ